MLQLFNEPFSTEATEAWDSLKRTHKRGDLLSGRVIRQKPYGVFVDAGLGFLVLLEIAELQNAGSNQYSSLAEHPPVGSIVAGRLTDFTDRNRQVRASQRFEELERQRAERAI